MRTTITSKGAKPVAVPSGRLEAHTKVPSGPQGRVLRLADSADSGWQATLDGSRLTPTTVDGWAQGFQLPADGGRLDVTFKEPVTHIGWLGVQAFLLLVTIVCVALVAGSLPGAIAGFAGGLVVDVMTLGTLGTTSIVLTLAGYWAGRYGETTGRGRAYAPPLAAFAD